MTDPLKAILDLEAKYRKKPEAPRHWAQGILAGTYKLEDVPEHLRGIVSDYCATHKMHVQAAAERILALPNGKARLAAFNALEAPMRDPVRSAVHELRNKALKSKP